MNSPRVPTDFIATKEHRRFAEFCDACRRDRYIGLCYGPPGVGKTLSARHYVKWWQLETYQPVKGTTETEFAEIVGSNTIFYTPHVVNSPNRIEQDIQLMRNRLRALALEKLYREQEVAREAVRQREAALLQQYLNDPAWRSNTPPLRPPKTAPTDFDIIKYYSEQRDATATRDPTRLLIIDETDRLKTAGLEQVREGALRNSYE